MRETPVILLANSCAPSNSCDGIGCSRLSWGFAASSLRTFGIGLFICIVAATQAMADVADVKVTDVTDRSFSLVWASENPVNSAGVRVFADADGVVELEDFETTLVSEQFPPALDNGIVKVVVSGFQPDTTLYYQTLTGAYIPDEGLAIPDDIEFPAGPPFPSVTTASEARKINAVSQPIVNDLLRIPGLAPDQLTAATGTLIVLDAQDTGIGPISAFVTNGGLSSNAIVDLNNIFDVIGQNAEIPDDEILLVTHYRGRLCTLESQKLVRFRRVPAHAEVPRITEVEDADTCFFADGVCDDTVNILDFQFVLNAFNRTLGDCSFNPDLDVVQDDVINILDVQSVLNRFGQSAPFPP